jgi:cytochrome c-type biogenesis protein CcmH
MQQDAYLPVKLAPKPGASPSMTDEGRDDLEHRIKCQCGCVLDVFTCRTTDFTCAVSPAMHADVMGLVSGGYSAAEILSAFQQVYGERVLMAPPGRGFNLLGYVMPFVALAGGGAAVFILTRRWKDRAARMSPPAPEIVDATDAELEAVEAAVRRGG